MSDIRVGEIPGSLTIIYDSRRERKSADESKRMLTRTERREKERTDERTESERELIEHMRVDDCA